LPGCCSPFTDAASAQFDQRRVAQELKQYRKKGAGKTTRLLADGIAEAGALGGTVLDVGAGFGGLTFALLDRGATRAVAIDASKASVVAAGREVVRQGKADAVRIVHADFVDVAAQVPAASIVTLDRVVCCYPAYAPLLEAALRHAERCVALAYPRDLWFVRLAITLENGRRRLAGNSFRAFVHPVAAMEDTIRRAGFRLANRRTTWMWAADVYVRQSVSGSV